MGSASIENDAAQHNNVSWNILVLFLIGFATFFITYLSLYMKPSSYFMPKSLGSLMRKPQVVAQAQVAIHQNSR